MILALHGFLGLPDDWLSFDFGDEVVAVNLWHDAELSISAWTDRILDFVRGLGEKPLLLGYSMGGRLAMHAALAAPELFRAAVFVSANPGLQSKSACEDRLLNDRAWAERFLNEDWQSVVEAWNRQPVLLPPAGRMPLERREENFSRRALTSGLISWSLGHQADLRPGLERLQLPVLFVSGERDEKFTALLKGLRLNSLQQLAVVPDAGHRIPWDNPEAFTNVMQGFNTSYS